MLIPYRFVPRDYQENLLAKMDGGCKRAVLVWHRRCGKDKTCFNYMVKRSLERVGTYFYILPTYSQGRKVIRDGFDKAGFRTIDHIPKEIIKHNNGQEMKIELINGSIIQIVGTDSKNIDRLVGTNPIGVVMSEYSLQNPRAWDLLRPILAENGGWCIFNYTPRGKNHGYDLYNMAMRNNSTWFCELLTVDDTKAIPYEVIKQEKTEMDEDYFLQEYYCSFEAAVKGSLFTKEIKTAYESNNITIVPHEEALDVDTYWDIGIGTTSILFIQRMDKEFRIIDHYEGYGESLSFYIGILNSKGYRYGMHHFPHDFRVKEFGSGKTREDQILNLGIRNYRILKSLSDSEGVSAIKKIFPYCFFDKDKTEFLIRCLNEIHRERDDKKKEFKENIFEDRTNHAYDTFKYFGFDNIDKIKNKVKQEAKKKQVWNPILGRFVYYDQ